MDTTDPLSHFARRLKELRKAKGWTMYRLAKEAGITDVAVSKLETGKALPAVKTAQVLAAALGVEWADLLGPVKINRENSQTSVD